MTKGSSSSKRTQGDHKRTSKSGRSVVKKQSPPQQQQQHQQTGDNNVYHAGYNTGTPGHLSRSNSGNSPEVMSALAEYEMHLALLEQEDENTIADSASPSSSPSPITSTTTDVTTSSIATSLDTGGASSGGSNNDFAYASPTVAYSSYWGSGGAAGGQHEDDTTPLSVDGYVSIDYVASTILPSLDVPRATRHEGFKHRSSKRGQNK
ncbi:hypothetical protein BD289DRAFT_84523 [Coniella lustricola]|uniref:Uncharacterized protein n=1 Tax=Coniella lustricola TaxID=2025994 RepID=A0A2T3AHK8_9PEZI|nr:hypothetical protein BD289DRAFT_84523 [Coniella lustricola]